MIPLNNDKLSQHDEASKIRINHDFRVDVFNQFDFSFQFALIVSLTFLV